MSEIDLHVHTTASDGTMSPSEVVRYAKEKKLRAIAITDHDTVAGVEEGIREGERVTLEVISGVEVSADFPKGTMHLLGYCIDHHCPELLGKLELLQRYRSERNSTMVKKFKDMGITIDLSEVTRIAEDGQIGRPHFARLLVQKGYVKDIQEAFDRFLRKGGPAYVEKFRFSPDEAMMFIAKAGGVSVLAHPFTLNQLQARELEGLIANLSKQGLEGIEVYYPEHTEGQKKLFRNLAQRYGLLISGGSDFHGLYKEGVGLGEGYADKELPYSLVEKLKAKCKQNPAREI